MDCIVQLKLNLYNLEKYVGKLVLRVKVIVLEAL